MNAEYLRFARRFLLGCTLTFCVSAGLTAYGVHLRSTWIDVPATIVATSMPTNAPCTVTISYVARDGVRRAKELDANSRYCRSGPPQPALVASYDPRNASNVVADALQPFADGPRPGPQAPYFVFLLVALLSGSSIAFVLLGLAVEWIVGRGPRSHRQA